MTICSSMGRVADCPYSPDRPRATRDTAGPPRVILNCGEARPILPIVRPDSLKSRRYSVSRKSPVMEKSAKPADGTASQKCSITLYQTDLDILDEIRNFLRRHGVRNLSDSEALRLACRTILLNDKLLKTYESMRLDDGRRKR